MGDFLRRYAWTLPVAFALLLAGIGWTSYRTLEQGMKAEIASKLETTRDTTISALQIWAEENTAVVNVHASRKSVVEAAMALTELEQRGGDLREALLASPVQASLRRLMAPVSEGHGYQGWAIVSLTGKFLAGGTDRNLGRHVTGVQASIDEWGTGRTTVAPPTVVPLLDQQPVALMLIGGPVRDDRGQVIAVFGFSLDPEQVLGRLLVVSRLGESGETYGFDEDGILLSPSRFDEELRLVGLLPDDSQVSSYLNIHVRDPGGNVREGFVPSAPPKARPLTLAAASAVGGESGVDVDGYPDYRGVPVVGAWAWVPELGIGIASEIEVSEAYAGLTALQRQFGVIVVPLALAAIGMFLYSFVLMRMGRQVDQARQLGRYQVERKLGQGGMGTVYLARHALLQRPAAVKVLEQDVAGAEAVARFEREVQITGALSHPNTIEIYDFGRTPDGAFYYAMEYVRGLTLQALVDEGGPQHEGRVVHILRQAAGSLAEAHRGGIIHRDIKPSNIMLCERGGVFDYVKVLDFGLVRMNQQPADLALTGTQALTGSPLYMSPEALERPKDLDVRSDVYQLGAVAYFLLAGQPPFSGGDLVEVLAKHLKQRVVAPSEILGRPVSSGLEALVIRCLEKEPEARLGDAAELLAELDACDVAQPWTQDAAGAWWLEWSESQLAATSEASGGSGSGTPSGWSIDLASRLRRS